MTLSDSEPDALVVAWAARIRQAEAGRTPQQVLDDEAWSDAWHASLPMLPLPGPGQVVVVFNVRRKGGAQ